MDIDKITDLPGLSKARYSLEELEEMNRDMESIKQLMDSIKDIELPLKRETRSSSNVYRLRPDISIPGVDVL